MGTAVYNVRLIVEKEELLRRLPFLCKKQRIGKGAKADGIRYEKKAQQKLQEMYGGSYLASPWFSYRKTPNGRLCIRQPDGLVFDFHRGIIFIVEIKLRHTADAWTQIRRVYEPLVRAAFPRHLWEIRVCEVVRWFDPHTYFPEDISMVESVDAVLPARFGVHILSVRRNPTHRPV